MRKTFCDISGQEIPPPQQPYLLSIEKEVDGIRKPAIKQLEISPFVFEQIKDYLEKIRTT